MTLTLTTQLEAINTMLSTIGEAPVNTLEGDRPVDVEVALQILSEVNREVQMRGWYFNIENDYALAPDENGELAIAANMLSVAMRPGIYTNATAIARGSKLYNLAEHSYLFGSPVYADVTFLLEFEEIPQQARHYIAIRAARKFHDRLVGSGTLHDFSAEDELKALTDLLHDDSKNADRSVFGRNILSGWYMGKTIRRFR